MPSRRAWASGSLVPMTTPEATTDHAALVTFIAGQQADPTLACGYVGTLDDGLQSDLEDLADPGCWTEQARVILAADGQISGAALVDVDEEVGRAWIWGPWTTPDTWDRDAAALLTTVMDLAPGMRYETYADVANHRLAALTTTLGWAAGDINYVYRADAAGARGGAVGDHPDSSAAAGLRIRPATPDDLSAIAALHEAEFPGTYASARQLLDPVEVYTTLVAEVDGGFAGYVVGQPQQDKVYVHYVAVAPEARRRGVGEALMRAIVRELPGDTVSLTVVEQQHAARRLYEAMGYELEQATLAYTHEG